MKTISDYIKECHDTSRNHGWWHYPPSVPDHLKVTEKLCLIHSEVSEALEEVRIGNNLMYTKENKPEGLPAELADILIRVFDLAGFMGMDLEDALKKKMAYNETRTFRHGGKLA